MFCCALLFGIQNQGPQLQQPSFRDPIGKGLAELAQGFIGILLGARRLEKSEPDSTVSRLFRSRSKFCGIVGICPFQDFRQEASAIRVIAAGLRRFALLLRSLGRWAEGRCVISCPLASAWIPRIPYSVKGFEQILQTRLRRQERCFLRSRI